MTDVGFATPDVVSGQPEPAPAGGCGEPPAGGTPVPAVDDREVDVKPSISRPTTDGLRTGGETAPPAPWGEGVAGRVSDAGARGIRETLDQGEAFAYAAAVDARVSALESQTSELLRLVQGLSAALLSQRGGLPAAMPNVAKGAQPCGLPDQESIASGWHDVPGMQPAGRLGGDWDSRSTDTPFIPSSDAGGSAGRPSSRGPGRSLTIGDEALPLLHANVADALDFPMDTGSLLVALLELGRYHRCHTASDALERAGKGLTLSLSGSVASSLASAFQTAPPPASRKEELVDAKSRIASSVVQGTALAPYGASAFSGSIVDFLTRLGHPFSPVMLDQGVAREHVALAPGVREVLGVLRGLSPTLLAEKYPAWPPILREFPEAHAQYHALHTVSPGLGAGGLASGGLRIEVLDASPLPVTDLVVSLGILTPLQMRLVTTKCLAEYELVRASLPVLQATHSYRSVDAQMAGFFDRACTQLGSLWCAAGKINEEWAGPAGMGLTPLEWDLCIPQPFRFPFSQLHRLVADGGGGSNADWNRALVELERFTVELGEGSAVASRWQQLVSRLQAMASNDPRRSADLKNALAAGHRYDTVVDSVVANYEYFLEHSPGVTRDHWSQLLGPHIGELRRHEWPRAWRGHSETPDLGTLFGIIGSARIPSVAAPSSRRVKSAAVARADGTPGTRDKGHVRVFPRGTEPRYRLINVDASRYKDGGSLVSPGAKSILHPENKDLFDNLSPHVRRWITEESDKSTILSYELVNLVVKGAISNKIGKGQPRIILVPAPLGVGAEDWNMTEAKLGKSSPARRRGRSADKRAGAASGSRRSASRRSRSKKKKKSTGGPGKADPDDLVAAAAARAGDPVLRIGDFTYELRAGSTSAVRGASQPSDNGGAAAEAEEEPTGATVVRQPGRGDARELLCVGESPLDSQRDGFAVFELRPLEGTSSDRTIHHPPPLEYGTPSPVVCSHSRFREEPTRVPSPCGKRRAQDAKPFLPERCGPLGLPESDTREGTPLSGPGAGPSGDLGRVTQDAVDPGPRACAECAHVLHAWQTRVSELEARCAVLQRVCDEGADASCDGGDVEPELGPPHDEGLDPCVTTRQAQC